MLKFMKHQQKITPERLQKQKELFAFNEACYHGFPAKPSALAWDPELRLLAIATKTAQIRVYGEPGLEVYGQHGTESAITHLNFLPGQCRLVSLCEDNSLHLWQLSQDEQCGGMKLTEVNSTSLEGKLKKISVIVADSKCEHLMVGTEGGNIYLLNLATFAMSDNIIYQDVVMQNVPEDYKVNPGPVEAIAEHPEESNKILIGYQRGLIVLWDKKNLCADQTYVCSQQLEAVCWHSDAAQFTTSHNDGSYMVWSATESAQPADGPHTVYGPFPCKPITKILRPTIKDGDLIVFSGGMPRASYGDRNTVTAINGENHVTFNLTSKIIDFEVVKDSEDDNASCLVVLAEEEIIFIDLLSEDWPAYHSPYLASLHSSAITCCFLASSMAADVYDKIKEAGMKQQVGLSKLSWPINGGDVKAVNTAKQMDVLLTGHEDGTVQFWDASGVSLKLLYKLSTSQLFVSEDLGGEGAAAEDDDWPPFRKAGLFDPYSDDPRLGIKKMEMCPYTGTLVVAGTAGQVLILSLNLEEKEIVPECVDVNLVAETDNFVWKSHNKLDLRTEAVKFEPGMQPKVLVQFYPPASCTSLTLHSEWGLLACGTAHGFALFDIIQSKNILSKSTLSPLDLANAADEGPMSRRKSLKKSLRESFRRLRRGRSQRKTAKTGVTSPTSPDEDESEVEEGEEEEFELSGDEREEGEQEDAEAGRADSGETESQAQQENPPQNTEAVEEVSVPVAAISSDEAPSVAPSEVIEAHTATEVTEAHTATEPEEVIIEVQGDDNAETDITKKPKQTKVYDGTEVREAVPFFYYVTPKRFREGQKSHSKKEKESQDAVKKDLIEKQSTVSTKEEGQIIVESEEEELKKKTQTPEIFDLQEKEKTSKEQEFEKQGLDSGKAGVETEGTEKSRHILSKLFTKEQDREEVIASKDQVTSKTGVIRFKDWIRKREAEIDTKGLDSEESKGGSLRRFLKWPKDETTDHPRIEAGGNVGNESTKETSVSRRQRLIEAFRRRHHSEESNVIPTEPDKLPVLEESQIKSRSLTRPSVLWLGTRSKSEKQPTPVANERSSIPIATPEGVSITPEKDELEEAQVRKRTFLNMTLRGLKLFQSQDEDAGGTKTSKYLESPKGEVGLRTPSYERAIAGNAQSDQQKNVSETDEGTGKIKKLFKRRSEGFLRSFGRLTNEEKEKRKSAPVPVTDLPSPLESEEVLDLEARHPSINTYIDDTPSASCGPQIPPENSFPVPVDEPTGSSPPPVPQEEHEALSHNSPETPDSDADSVVLDMHSMQSTPDIVRKAPDSRVSTLERTLGRKLTFSLPFGSGGGGGAAAAEEEGLKPVERAVEARSQTSDYIGSMVRCLHLTKCFIANNQMMSATLWAGTNSGAIYVFTIAIPPSDKRGQVNLTIQLGKEIHLKHGAPVISVCILDGTSKPFPEPMAVKKEAAPAPNPGMPHRVLICSEEQFKVFTLPQLKPFCKFKLTAHEGSRVRKIGYGEFTSTADENYRESSLMVMTNQGDFSVYSLPDCRRQIQEHHLKKEDINGINSVVFSNRGEALYMLSPCELERVSLSAKHITRPTGIVKPSKTISVPEEQEKTTEEKPSDGRTEEEEGGATAAAAAVVAAADVTAASAPEVSEPTVNLPAEKEADNATSKEDAVEKTNVGEAVGGSNKKVEEVKENGDNSVLSGDITIDSIRDHMDELKLSEKSEKTMEVAGEESSASSAVISSSSTTTKENSSSVTVVKSTTITSVTSQESSSVQVVETTSTEVNHSAVNGTE